MTKLLTQLNGQFDKSLRDEWSTVMDDQTEQLIYWIIIPIYGSHLQYKERQKGRNRKVQIAKDDSQ